MANQLCKAEQLQQKTMTATRHQIANSQGILHLNPDRGLRKYMLNLPQLKMQCQLHSIAALLSNTGVCCLPSKSGPQVPQSVSFSLRSASRWTVSCRVPCRVSQQTHPMIPHCCLLLTLAKIGLYLSGLWSQSLHVCCTAFLPTVLFPTVLC